MPFPRLSGTLAALCLAAAGWFALHAQSRAELVPVRLMVLNTPEEAEQMRTMLQSGADFAVLAREKSIDATALDGGLLGNVDPSTLREELRAVLNGLKPGEMSGIAKLPNGFAIVKVLASAETLQLADVERARRFQVSAEGAVRFSFDISGLNETEAALASFPKPANWYEDLMTACRMRTESLAAVNARADRLFANPPARPFDAMSVRVAKGQLYAYTGDMNKALEWWETSRGKASQDLPEALPYLDELLGIGYLHRAWSSNDVFHAPGERCIYPIEAKLASPADSLKSAEYLERALKSKPGDIEMQWLLNIVNMTLSKTAKGYASAANIGRFKDVAAAAGLDIFSIAGGLVVDDFDGDGLPDVVTSSFDMCVPMRFHHNNGNGTFTDRSAKAGLLQQFGGLNMIQADYDNDGCTDILVMRGGWEVPQRRSLLHNNCKGTFTDVTKESGLGGATSSQTGVWVDIDNDGWLDLFAGSENGANQMFLNNRDGTFKDISHAARVDLTAFTKGVAAADYDGDGYIDLYVSNYRGDNALYRNNHDRTFTEIAKQAGVTGTGHGFPAWFFDYNNDGWPDILATSYYMSTEETARTHWNLPHNGGTMKLYRNLGNGAFRDVTAEVGLDKVLMPMGANFGDVNNDGYPDIYLGTGNPSYASLAPNVLLLNQGGDKFVDITASSRTGELHKGHAVAIADIDGDGNQEILTVIGGATQGDAHAFRLFRNPGQGNDWLNVRLVGTKANRSAIGARIQVTVRSSDGSRRDIYASVGSGGSFGASPLAQHLGLGKAAGIDKVEIWWPGQNELQTLTNVKKNQTIQIRQGRGGE